MSPIIVTTVRNLLSIRDSALADLQANNFRNPDSDWVNDRIKDVSYVNNSIERIATAHSLTPPALITACQPK